MIDPTRPPPRTEIRTVVRPLANPLPLGLLSFGIGMLLLGAQTAGWAPSGEAPQFGLLVAAFVFPLEGTAALMAFAARDTLAATVLGIFTTSWLALGLSLIVEPPGARSVALGFYLLGFAAAVGSLAVAAVAGKPLIAMLLTLSAARAVLDGLYEVTGATSLRDAAGYVAAALALGAWYVGIAFLLEDLRGEALLPTVRRGAGLSAVDGDPTRGPAHAVGEPGVREQL
jgi:succinate-acetate transporter protein